MAYRTPALVIAHRDLLRAEGGGVQVCHREYLTALGEAGFDCADVCYTFDNPIASRLWRKVFPRLTPMHAPRQLATEALASLERTQVGTVFFALNVFPDLVAAIRKRFPNVQQVLLAHGVESVDFCIEQRIRRETHTENRAAVVAERMLGREVMDEVAQRTCVDAVLTLSPFEADLERWLGAKRAMWVPRTVSEPPLALRPVDGRVGCVSTLNHPPNLSGLMALFDAMQRTPGRKPRFRLIGQPVNKGQELAQQYSFVEYLGQLSDAELRDEAASWCCFVHPMFVYAKGCSTKLAIALGWGLPVATTKFGVRGYVWDEELVPLAQSPIELAELTRIKCTIDQFAPFQQRTSQLCTRTPSITSVGAEIREFLDY